MVLITEHWILNTFQRPNTDACHHYASLRQCSAVGAWIDVVGAVLSMKPGTGVEWAWPP